MDTGMINFRDWLARKVDRFSDEDWDSGAAVSYRVVLAEFDERFGA